MSVDEPSFIKFGDNHFWKAGTEGLVGDKMVPYAAGESPSSTAVVAAAVAAAAPIAAGSSSSLLATTAAAAATTVSSPSSSLAHGHTSSLLNGIPNGKLESLWTKAKMPSRYSDPSELLENAKNSTPGERERESVVGASVHRKDGLMVLAFFYEKILFDRKKVNISDAHQYKDVGQVLYDGRNMSMFDAIRACRHTVNPDLDAKDGVWSNMEWDNLLYYKIMQKNMPVPRPLPEIQTPLEFSQGGLGWYDNLDFRVRQRQGDLASKHGVDGFVFYTTVNQKSPGMMRAVVDARVRDGEPAGTFAVMMVDECRHACSEKELLGTENLVDFGKWLGKITNHSDYIRVNGRLVVYVYKLGIVLADGDTVAGPKSTRRALLLVEEMAGTPLHWIGTDSFHCLRGVRKKEKRALYKDLDAWIDFAPHKGHCMTAEPPSVSPHVNTFYETFLSGWYPAPRGLTWFGSKHGVGWKGTAYREQAPCKPQNSPARFYKIMKESLIRIRCQKEEGRKGLLENNGRFWKPATIFAWNEWGKQAVLEPSTLHGFLYLESLRRARRDAARVDCSHSLVV